MILGQTFAKFFAIFSILGSVTCLSRHHCEAETGNSSEKLRCQLFSNYNASILPDITSPDYLQALDLNVFYADIDVSGIFQLIGDAKAIWEDKQMIWEPNEHNNTYSLNIQNDMDQIWKPDFILTNYIFPKNKSLLVSDYNATIMHNGTIIFLMKYISIQAKCQVTVKSRPWFNHTCQLDLKTSSPNSLFIIHQDSVVNAEIESPWTVNKTRQMKPKDDNNEPPNYSISIDVELHRNISLYNSTRCISDPSTFEEQVKCNFSTLNLLSPPSEANVSQVDSPLIDLYFSYVDLNIEDGIFLLIGKIHVQWRDGRITWDKQKFGNLWYIRNFDVHSIWKPSLILNNHLFPEDRFYNETFGVGDLTIYAGGLMMWDTSVRLPTRCDMNYASWPWEPRTCCLNFTYNTPAMDLYLLKVLSKHPGVPSLWTITNMKEEYEYPKLNVEVTLKMKSNSLQVVWCSTFIALCLVMLPSFLISPISNIKLTSKVISLLLFTIFLTILINSIPNFTLIAPNFMLGYIMLLIILGISSCITAYLVRLAKKSHSFNSSLSMENLNSEENECNKSTMKTKLFKVFHSTRDEYIPEESLSNMHQDKRLKIAAVIEYSSLAICSIICVFLFVSFIS